jgi:hypothetical protein
MADSDKDILITPNSGQAAEPIIKWNGANNTPLYTRVLDDGTISFEGTAGQLFSISDGLSGVIFSVNDISGIPSIEVLDTGEIKFAPFGGIVTAPTAEAGTNTTQIATTAFVSTALSSATGGAVISDTAPESPTSGKIWYNSLSGKTYIYYEDGTSNQWVEVGTASLDPVGNYDAGFPDTIFGGASIIDGGGVS